WWRAPGIPAPPPSPSALPWLSSPSVDPLLRLELRDRHGLVAQLDAAVLRAVGQRVLEPLRVVAVREVLAHVGAAALLALDAAQGGDLRKVEEVPQLPRLQQVGVESLPLVHRHHAAVALLQLAQLLAGLLHPLPVAEDADAVLHRVLHLLAEAGGGLAVA